MERGAILIGDKPISRIANGMKDVNKRIETHSKEIQRMSSIEPIRLDLKSKSIAASPRNSGPLSVRNKGANHSTL